MIHNEYVVWYSILQVAVAVGWMQFNINLCNDSDLLLFLFSGSINSLQQIYFSTASCSLFNTSVNSIIGCRRNIAYNSFISFSKCTLQTSIHNLYHGKSSLDQELVHKQTCCVHTTQTLNVCQYFLDVVSCIFAQSSFYSSSLYTVHLRALAWFQCLRIGQMKLSHKTSWLWRACSSVDWLAYCTFC